VVDGHTCVLDILDTAGQEDMKMLRRQWVEDRDGFVLVFSIVERSSFDEIVQFFELIQQVKEDQIQKVPLVLVGNKVDMAPQRKVTLQEAQDLAKSYNAGYIETSAKNGINVNEAFEMLVRDFIRLSPPPISTGKKQRKPCAIL
jgi:small GTP-binding protein